MKLFPTFEPDDDGVIRLFVRYRAEGQGSVGDGASMVEPGGAMAGLTSDEWAMAAREGRTVEAP